MDLPPFRVLSLCAGGGGFDLGLRLAVPTARTICAVEIEAYACEILATRMEEGYVDPAPIWTDLRTFDGDRWRGVVDCVIGGYPCQPFSVAGKQRGKDDPRHLWPEVARIIAEIEPAFCFFENVGNHLRLGFDEVAGELRGMGYEVAAGLFTAEEVGAPHKRERLFILAHSKCAEWWPINGSCGDDREDCLPQRQEGSSGVGKRNSPLAHTTLAQSGRDGKHCGAEPTWDSGTGVVDATRHGRGEGWSQHAVRSRRDTLTDTSGANVAHPLGRQQTGRGSGCGSAGSSRSYSESTRSSPLVGNSDIPRSQGRGRSILQGGDELPAWPPGPEDTNAWSIILDRWPEVEPAICGVADGMAPRVDRLRLTGNGVVPDVAAFAFRTLCRDLMEEMYGEYLQESSAA